jgi:hypothetical protein
MLRCSLCFALCFLCSPSCSSLELARSLRMSLMIDNMSSFVVSSVPGVALSFSSVVISYISCLIAFSASCTPIVARAVSIYVDGSAPAKVWNSCIRYGLSVKCHLVWKPYRNLCTRSMGDLVPEDLSHSICRHPELQG